MAEIMVKATDIPFGYLPVLDTVTPILATQLIGNKVIIKTGEGIVYYNADEFVTVLVDDILLEMDAILHHNSIL